MKFSDILRKLGILRYGAKAGTYTSGRDRPAEFMMDGVYDAEKDLTTKQDVARMEEALHRTGGRKALFWIAAALAFLVLLLFTAAGGVSVWLFCNLILWVGILFVVQRFAWEGRYSFLGIIALLVFAVLASFILLGVSVSD